MNEFKTTNDQLILALSDKTDEWLENIVEYRTYTFAHLLDGIVKHHIYHLAQINYIGKAVTEPEPAVNFPL